MLLCTMFDHIYNRCNMLPYCRNLHLDIDHQVFRFLICKFFVLEINLALQLRRCVNCYPCFNTRILFFFFSLSFKIFFFFLPLPLRGPTSWFIAISKCQQTQLSSFLQITLDRAYKRDAKKPLKISCLMLYSCGWQLYGNIYVMYRTKLSYFTYFESIIQHYLNPFLSDGVFLVHFITSLPET